jgi:hypothetical protein
MNKLLAIGAVAILSLALTTPAGAGHHGYRRGHGGGSVTHRGHVVVARPYAYNYWPRPRAFFSVGFGVPGYGYYPAPVYYGPPAVAYGGSACDLWVPGHFVWDGGARFWIEGHWFR